MKEIAKLLKESNSTVVFTGAGMSTESGLPDFRSEDRGLWKKFNPDELANVNALNRNPSEFTAFYQHRFEELNRYQAHEGHYILAEWEKIGLIDGVITQNVDGFHHDAGNQNVMELHGSFRTLHCHYCNQQYEREDYISGETSCNCGGIIRPGITLFGEMLPEGAFHHAEKLSTTSDLFIVLGSSLTVSPANSFPLIAKQNGARLVIINQEVTPYNPFADKVIQDKTIKEVLVGIDDIYKASFN